MNLYLGDQEGLFSYIESNSVDAIITDPPYCKHNDKSFDFDIFLDNVYRVLKKGGVFVYFGMEPNIIYRNYLSQERFNYLDEIILYKKIEIINSANNNFIRKKAVIFTKGEDFTNLYPFHILNDETINNIFIDDSHAIIEKVLDSCTNQNNIILDPFMGDGSTGLIATSLNRKFIGFEINQHKFNEAKKKLIT